MRILVLSAESHLAQKMVRMIRKVIEKNPLTKNLRPSNPDQWAADSFTVNRKRISRDPSVLARGLYANVTGTRADIIICDDVEVPNTCDTAEKRKGLRERLAENDFILTPKGLQIYIGTPHTYYTIYADKPREEIGETEVFLKGYHRMSVPLLDEEGNSAWPERYDDEAIAELKRSSGPFKFASQMMLRPINITEGRLNVNLLRRYSEDLFYREVQKSMVLSIGGRRMVSASAWWDPAFGKAGDSSVLAVVYTDQDGDYWLHRMLYISVKAGEGEDEATLQCRAVAQVAKELFIPFIAVETNGLGKFLPAILRIKLAEEKVPCSVIENHSARKKDVRILEAFDAIMAARRLYVHESVYRTPFINEMVEWRPGASVRDDGLDAASGAINLEPLRIRRIYQAPGKIWSGSGSGHAAMTDFDV